MPMFCVFYSFISDIFGASREKQGQIVKETGSFCGTPCVQLFLSGQNDETCFLINFVYFINFENSF